MAAAGDTRAFIPHCKIKDKELRSHRMGGESVALIYRATGTLDRHQHAV